MHLGVGGRAAAPAVLATRIAAPVAHDTGDVVADLLHVPRQWEDWLWGQLNWLAVADLQGRAVQQRLIEVLNGSLCRRPCLHAMLPSAAEECCTVQAACLQLGAFRGLQSSSCQVGLHARTQFTA